MAGTIIADFIRTDANQLSLNVGNTTFATINASGFFSNTGTQLIAANGRISGASVIASSIPGTAFATAAIPSSKIGTGAVLQVVSTLKTDTFTSSSTSFTNITGLTGTITPISTSSKILVMASVAVGLNPVYFQHIRLARDGSAIAQGDAAGSRLRTQGMVYMYNQINPSNAQITWPGIVLDSPASISALTYSVQMRQIDGATMYVNRLNRDDDASYEPRSTSSLILMEIAG
jgi:hypothetical protein